MNSTLSWILLGELLAFGLLIAVFLALASRRQQQKLLSAVNHLLESLNQGEQQRLQQQQKLLMSVFHATEDAAGTASAELARGEKEFIRALLEILLTQDMEGLTRIHLSLHKLVDEQLKTLAEALPMVAPATLSVGDPGQFCEELLPPLSPLEDEPESQRITSPVADETSPAKPKRRSAPQAQKQKNAEPAGNSDQ